MWENDKIKFIARRADNNNNNNNERKTRLTLCIVREE